MTSAKPYILIAVIALIVSAIYFISSNSITRRGPIETETVSPKEDRLNVSQEKSKRYELAKEITTPDGFINTDGEPITVGGFIGKKVVLLDFWTYSCINCQRTTPYLNSWYEKYKDKGLIIVGVHTPEFEFEKDYNNVKAAVEKFDIKFPVVLDNDYSTWTAYKNRYWPRKYLIDIDGYIIYDHIGEGAYEETEQKIQEALKERMAVLGERGILDDPLTEEIAVRSGARSPETYFGSAREPSKKSFLFPSDGWNITPEFAENNSSGASIVYQYTAKDVFFVGSADAEIVIEVLLDGNPLGLEAGADIIKDSSGKTLVKIKEARLYKIIQDSESKTHTLEFKILKPGLKAFTFTFG